MSSVAFTLKEKLNDIAGDGRAKDREARVRSELRWRGKAESAVRHLLAGTRKPNLEEAFQIVAAHDRIEREKSALTKIMQAGVRAMENSNDAEFYADHIDAVRRYLFPNGNMAGGKGGQD